MTVQNAFLGLFYIVLEDVISEYSYMYHPQLLAWINDENKVDEAAV